MDKKQLKQDRVRGYFLEAACDIIEAEGQAEASVRKVSERAGYHYTTFYAHFESFDDLLFQAAMRFTARVAHDIELAVAGVDDALEAYLLGWEAYSRFMLRHPHIARCIVVEQTAKVPDETMATLPANPLATLQRAMVADCVAAGVFPGGDAVRDVVDMSAFVCTGGIVQFLNGRRGISEDQVVRLSRRALVAIITGVNRESV